MPCWYLFLFGLFYILKSEKVLQAVVLHNMYSSNEVQYCCLYSESWDDYLDALTQINRWDVINTLEIDKGTCKAEIKTVFGAGASIWEEKKVV